MEKIKNMIRIKDLPSNTIEEAILILKENKRAKRYESTGKFKNSNYKKCNDEDFVIKEAELIISNYLDGNDESRKDLKSKKIRRLKIINGILVLFLIISIIF